MTDATTDRVTLERSHAARLDSIEGQFKAATVVLLRGTCSSKDWVE